MHSIGREIVNWGVSGVDHGHHELFVLGVGFGNYKCQPFTSLSFVLKSS